MTSKHLRNALFLIIGGLLWLLYFCLLSMSKIGLYAGLPYYLFELLDLLPLLLCNVSLLWLVFLVYRMTKTKKLREYLLWTLILLVLCVPQLLFIQARLQPNQGSTTFSSPIARLENGEPGELFAIVEHSEQEALRLAVPYPFQGLLRVDGTVYRLTYYWQGIPNEGDLSFVTLDD